MALVQFTRDFQGRATAERFYTARTVVELPDWQADACIAEGAAVYVTPPPDSAPVATSPATGDAAAVEVVRAAIEATIDPIIEYAAEVRAEQAKPAKKRASKKAAKPSHGDHKQ